MDPPLLSSLFFSYEQSSYEATKLLLSMGYFFSITSWRPSSRSSLYLSVSKRGVVAPLSLPQREHRSITEAGLAKLAGKTAAAAKENVAVKTPLTFLAQGWPLKSLWIWLQEQWRFQLSAMGLTFLPSHLSGVLHDPQTQLLPLQELIMFPALGRWSLDQVSLSRWAYSSGRLDGSVNMLSINFLLTLIQSLEDSKHHLQYCCLPFLQKHKHVNSRT